jgi:hypothetical protein
VPNALQEGETEEIKNIFRKRLTSQKMLCTILIVRIKHKKALEVKIMIRVQDVTQYQISNLDTSLPILRVRTVYGKTEIYTGNQAIKNLKIIREVFDRIEQELNH